jgi:hypothetical protein
MSRSKKNHTTNLTTLAKQAMETLTKLQDSLPLDDDLLAHDRKVANVRQAVSTTAIQAAVTILAELGDKAGGFDLEGTREALAFENELSGIAQLARSLADRIDTTIIKRRSKAVATATGLYQSLQGLARTDGTMIPYLDRLAPLVRRGRRSARPSAPTSQEPSPTQTPAVPANSGAAKAPTATA